MTALARRLTGAATALLLAVAVTACSSDGSSSGPTGSTAVSGATRENGATTPTGSNGSASPSTSPTPVLAALPQGADPVELDPADFVSVIDNPYWPLTPGSEWVYRETSGDGSVFDVVVTVTDRTKEIIGIRATVVHDVVSERGEIVEDTWDWYAQDRDGNVWYLGEDTKEFKNGKVSSTEGSWEAGVDGAQPGVILPAAPEPGLTYREEYLRGQAEDAATVLGVDEQVQVPFGTFDLVVLTKNFTPLEPNLVERKFYAAGVGQVLAITVSGGSDREELLSYTAG